MEWLQLPHWLMIEGTLLVMAGLIGLVDEPQATGEGSGRSGHRANSRAASTATTAAGSSRLAATKESALTLIGYWRSKSSGLQNFWPQNSIKVMLNQRFKWGDGVTVAQQQMGICNPRFSDGARSMAA
jgi:hypothetical protein